ncbi:MAG: host attachment protein [Alphaproteobacteria bacterium]|nr:host attachment protein [Alphaproteobacteria bacterium]
MDNTAVQLPQPPLVTWVLIADGKQAQIHSYNRSVREVPLGGANKHHLSEEKASHHLSPVTNGDMKAESINDYQLGHDRRGQTSSSNSPTYNTYEPQGDIHEELKRRFMKSIADKLHKAAESKSFDRLILVAPAKMIGELKEHMAADLQKRVVATLSKDLTHYQGEALMAHLQGTLMDAHIA